jgi:hypothetical protein
MIRLTASQKDALGSSARDEFVDRLARHMRRLFPEDIRCMGETKLHAELDRIVDRAAALGLSSELEIASLAEYILIYRLDLETEPASRIAQAEGLSRETKLQRLGAVALHGWAGSRQNHSDRSGSERG